MKGIRLTAAALAALSVAGVSAAAGAQAPAPTIVYRTVWWSSPRKAPNLYVVSPTGAGRRLLAVAADAPAWSPGRRRIAFSGAGYGGRQTGIWLMNANGTAKRRLTSGPADLAPTWSPDGRRIAFARGGDLWLVPSSGGRPTRLFGGRNTNETSPDWSPNGAWIAYESNRGGEAQIWIINVRTRGVRRLTRGARSNNPDWSPDGRRIAYATRGQIAVVGVTSADTRLLPTGFPRSAYFPSWSPDGKRLAFERGGQVLTTRATGGDVRYVTRAAWGTNGDPDW
jgi:Tol biopolymer transport system component